MIRPEVRAEMRRLVLGEGWKIETVARRFHVHHSVVRRAISDPPAPQHKPIAPSSLDTFKPYLLERLTTYPEMTAIRLFEEIQKRGYAHGVAQLRRWLLGVRTPRSKKAYLRIELEPGEQAQVDWGSFGQMRCGTTLRPLSVFAMVMSWSRALFLDFSLDQKTETFLRMHCRALEFFGGVPKKVLYDNLKSAVLHHIGTTVQFNPRLLSLAGHYLFEPAAAPPKPRAASRAPSNTSATRSSTAAPFALSTTSAPRQRHGATRSPTTVSTPPLGNAPTSDCSSSVPVCEHCRLVPSTPTPSSRPSSARRPACASTPTATRSPTPTSARPW